jgi:signal transduction histidine kinase
MAPWRAAALERGYRSVAAIPVRVRGSLTAAFTVYAAEPGFFGEENLALLDEVAADVAFALESIDREEERLAAQQEHARLLAREEAARAEAAAEARFRARLEAANQELEVRNREIERANRLKSEFLASMSHELRTPLNAIIGFSDLLAEEAPGPLTEKQQRFLGHIRDSAQHLLTLINDILDLSKIEAGRLELRREEFPVAAALAEVLPVVQSLASAKSVTLEAESCPGLMISADRVRFKQILCNLLSNAVKFTPEKGAIGIRLEREAPWARVTVWDTGIGIPPGEQQAIFNEFYQVGTTTRGVREGTGLGLAITRRLVEQHGGRIWVESEPGKGSRFIVQVPAVAALGEAS